jgi:thymidine kinase
MKTLICGPMYSGKTTALFQRLERQLFARKKVLLIRPKKDTRGYFTHSGGIDLNKLEEKYPQQFVVLEMKTFEPVDIKNIIADEFDAVFVDEYFMIPGIHHICHQNTFDVYFSGLLATSECELCTEAVKILPYCDKIKKLNAVCMDCGSELGSYSFADFEKTSEVVVGDAKYRCLCQKCYEKAMENKVTK